jgi:hypothetical protein
MRRDDGSDTHIAFHEAHLTLRDGTPVLIRRLVTEDALSRFSKQQPRIFGCASSDQCARCATSSSISSSTTIRPVPWPSIRRTSLFYDTDRPSWTGRMLRQTCANPEMPSSRRRSLTCVIYRGSAGRVIGVVQAAIM